MNPLQVDVAVESPAWLELLPAAEDICRKAAIGALGDAEGIDLPMERIEVSLVLADDALVRRLNRSYRDQDKPTNVLSFAALEEDAPIPFDGPVLIGDVIVARETVFAEAAAEGKPVADHLSHLVVHGVLHLLGYDHQDDDEANEMEARERDILASLGISDPYAMKEERAVLDD